MRFLKFKKYLLAINLSSLRQRDLHIEKVTSSETNKSAFFNIFRNLDLLKTEERLLDTAVEKLP